MRHSGGAPKYRKCSPGGVIPLGAKYRKPFPESTSDTCGYRKLMSVELKYPEIDDIPMWRFACHAGYTPRGGVMPTLHRTHHSARAGTAPAPRVARIHRGASPPARERRPVAPTRMNRAWPAPIALIAL